MENNHKLESIYSQSLQKIEQGKSLLGITILGGAVLFQAIKHRETIFDILKSILKSSADELERMDKVERLLKEELKKECGAFALQAGFNPDKYSTNRLDEVQNKINNV